MKEKKYEPITRRHMINAWTSSIGGIIFWVALGFLFFDWVWWIFLLIFLTITNPIQLTFRYYAEARLKCPRCGMEIEPGVAFCNACGTKIVTACPRCQARIYTMGRFCDQCGLKLYEEPQPSPVL